jgi:thiamine-phosphate pyrophosphorylase
VIPAVVVVTDRAQAAAAGRTLAATVAAALRGGAGAVLLRDKDLPAPARRRLAGELRALTAAADAALWVATDVALATEVGADGVHLAATDSWPAAARRGERAGGEAGHAVALPAGRSCHTVAELREAAGRGAAWATYSPVFATASKPSYGPALGLGGLGTGCQAVPGLPVLALGGIGPGRAGGCVGAGAVGVALMGAVMGAADPGAVVRGVVGELASLPSRR